MHSKTKALCLTFIFTFGTSWAADSQISAKKSKSWSLSASATLNSSMHQFDDPDKSLSSDLGVTHSYKFDNGIKAFTVVSGSKNLQGEREWNWSNVVLGMRTSLGRNESGAVGLSVLGYIPTSEFSKDYQKMITGIKASPSFTVFGKNFGMESLNITYVPNAAVYFHKYTTSLVGSSNTQYSLGNALSLGYGINDQISVSMSGSYNRSITYQGNQKDSYGFSTTLGYVPTSNTEIALGYANGGSPLAANGINTDIDVFDERSGVTFFSLGFSY